MSFDLTTYRRDTSVMLNSLAAGGTLIDILQIPARTSGSKPYPNVYQAANLLWIIASGGGPQLSASFSNGNPTLSWDYNVSVPAYDSVVLVFSNNNIGPRFGLQVLNSAGQLLVDPGYPAPQHIGNLALNSTPVTSYTTPDGYRAIVHSTPVGDLRSGANKVVLMALPDVGTDDTWYTLKNAFVLSSQGATSINIVVYTKAATYKLPSLHVFALDQPLASGDQLALRLYDASNKLTFDSSVECLTARTSLNVSFPNYGSAGSAYTLPFSATPGLSVPYYQTGSQSTTNSGNANRYTGVMKRVGMQVTTSTLFDYITSSTTDGYQDSYFEGGQTNRYCFVADVSALSPSATVLTTPSATGSPPTLGYLADLYAPAGQQTSFIESVGGSPAPTIQWTKNGSVIGGANASSYTFTPTSNDDLSTYQCIVTNAIGSVRSRIAKYYIDSSSGPTITSANFPSGNVNPGTVQVGYSASGTPTPICDLFLEGSLVASGSGSVSYNLSAAGGTTYHFEARPRVVAEHVTHTTSSFYTVTTAQPNPVQITANPANRTAQTGDTVSFSVSVSGQAPYYYSWFKDGNGIGPPNAQSNATTNGLNYTVQAGDNGSKFHCTVSNYPSGDTFQYSATTTDATLTVTQPPPPTPDAPTPVFSQSPSSTTVTAGQTATFNCAVSNYTSLQWYKNYVAIPGATGTSCSVPTSSSDAGSNFTINVQATNAPAGYNASSNWSSNATLTVQAPAAVGFTNYYGIGGSDDAYSAPAEIDIGRGNYGSPDGQISGTWGSGGSGDGTLYDVMLTLSSSAGNPDFTGSFSFGIWYSLSTYGGVGCLINPSGATGHQSSATISISIRLRSSGQTVSGGSVTLSTQNGGTQS